MVQNEYQKVLMVRNEIPSVFLFCEMAQNGFPSRFIFRGMAQNEVPSVFRFYEMLRNGIPSFFIFRGMARSGIPSIFRSAKHTNRIPMV